MLRPARRVAIGVAAGVILALAAATGVSAYWQAQQTISGRVVTGGDLNIISVVWANDPNWGTIGPGQTLTNQATVTYVTTGNNLTAQLTAAVSYNPAFDGSVTDNATVGTCGAPTGTFPMSVSPMEGMQVATVCVNYTLSSNAPSTLQGVNLTPAVTFTLAQNAS